MLPKLFMHSFDVPRPTFVVNRGVYLDVSVVEALGGVALNSWRPTIRDAT